MAESVRIPSRGETLAGLRFSADSEALASPAGRPCIVMAHGFGATVDSGLVPYAERFAAAGMDVLAFDYRGFGASTGEPRQLVSFRRHRQDYHAAIAFARGLDGIDPARIALWGSSYSGGHVIDVAADDSKVAAVVAQTAAVDGLGALLASIKQAGPANAARMTAVGMRDVVAMIRRRAPVMLPIVAAPGEIGAMTTPDAVPGMRAVAGPDWLPSICAREVLLIGLNRPGRRAGQVRCPMLFVIADHDSVTPPRMTQKAASAAGDRAEVRRYPTGHFDLYVGEWFERASTEMVTFLASHLAACVPAAAAHN